MADIMVEESSGSSKRSLTHALVNAIKSALKSVDGNHKVNITVVIDGYSFEKGEYKIAVRVLIMDLTLEERKAFHESHQEFMSRMDADQNLFEQMTAASYAHAIYDDTKPVDALEQQMDTLSDQYDNFGFNTDEDNITILAPQDFHDQMRTDYNAQFVHTHEISNDAPSLDLGGGSSNSDNKDTA